MNGFVFSILVHILSPETDNHPPCLRGKIRKQSYQNNLYRNIVTASGYYALFPCINRSIVRSQCIFVLLVNVILRSEMDHGWIVCKPTSPPFSK